MVHVGKSVKVKPHQSVSLLVCPVQREQHVGASARPGEEEQVEEPEQTGSDLPFAQDVVSTALHVSTSPPANHSAARWKMFMMKWNVESHVDKTFFSRAH